MKKNISFTVLFSSLLLKLYILLIGAVDSDDLTVFSLSHCQVTFFAFIQICSFDCSIDFLN